MKTFLTYLFYKLKFIFKKKSIITTTNGVKLNTTKDKIIKNTSISD